MCSSSCRVLRPLYGASIVQTLNRPISCRARYRQLRPRGSIRRLSARALAARMFNTGVYRRPPIVAYALLSRFVPSVRLAVRLALAVRLSLYRLPVGAVRLALAVRLAVRPSLALALAVLSRRRSFVFPVDGYMIPLVNQFVVMEWLNTG